MKSKLLFAAVIFTASLNVGKLDAQNQMCGQGQYLQNMIDRNPAILQQMKDYQDYQKNFIQQRKTAKVKSVTKYIIPIVFHIIHNYGPELILDSQIQDEVNILNRDYQKHNADTNQVVSPFDTIIADCQFEFRLAQLDPKGNCTTGIERIQSDQTYIGSAAAKLNQWPRDKYLNVWVVNTIANFGTTFTAAGYAQFPSAVSGYNYPEDGVMILHSYLGTIGTGAVFSSRALTHEIGHYLSLQHTWGPLLDPAVSCGDDGIVDTPPTKGHNNCNNPLDFYCSSETVKGTYLFNKVDLGSGRTDTTAVPSGVSPLGNSLLSFGHFTASNTLSANSGTAKQFAFSNWGTGAANGVNVASPISDAHDMAAYSSLTGNIDLNNYYEVKVTPLLGKSMVLSSITFSMNRSNTGPRTFAVRSSKDGFVKNMVASQSTDTNMRVTSSSMGAVTSNIFFYRFDTTTTVKSCTINLNPGSQDTTNTPLTFRFYAWNAEDAAGTFGIDSVVLNVSSGTTENVQNYMEYSYCSHMFTEDQKLAMEAALNSSVSGRNNLWTPANLAFTGVDGSAPCSAGVKPVADFKSLSPAVCTNIPVVFTDVSGGGAVVSRSWTFSNGTPATATTPSVPNVKFSTEGWQTVTLKVTNAAGTDSISKQFYVGEMPTPAHSTGSFHEDFEDPAEFNSDWIVNNAPVDRNNTSKWQVTNKAAYYGSNCLMLNSFYAYDPNYPFNANNGDIDEFITPSLNMSGVSPLYLSFRYSYASKAHKGSQVGETFNIYYSIDCGKNWNTASPDTNLTPKPTTTGNPSFLTAGSWDTEFTPVGNASTVWRRVSKKLPAINANSNLRLKFSYVSSSFSNDMYIDEINISTDPLGVNEATQDLNALSVFPNPTNDQATIAYHVNSKQKVDLAIYDMLGNKVMSLVNQSQEEGDYSYLVNKQDLSKGMYFIRLNVDDKSSAVKKFILLD